VITTRLAITGSAGTDRRRWSVAAASNVLASSTLACSLTDRLYPFPLMQFKPRFYTIAEKPQIYNAKAAKGPYWPQWKRKPLRATYSARQGSQPSANKIVAEPKRTADRTA